MKSLLITTLLLSFLNLQMLSADINDEEKIKILTNYLVEKEAKEVITARNEAIATIYGKPEFKDLVYNDASEMFFGSIVSERGNFKKDINFYMPKIRSIEFLKDLSQGKIEIEHAFDDNELVIKSIEVIYKGVDYPLKVNEANSFTLKVGGYFVTSQDTEILTQIQGVGSSINLQDFFNMKEEVNVFRLDILYKFNPNHAIEFSYYTINNSQTKTILNEFNWDKYSIKNGTLNATFNTDVYKLNYVYTAYKTNKIDLSLRAGLHITGLKTSITGEALVSDANTSKYVSIGSDSDLALTAPLPVLGLGLSYEIIPSLHLNYTVDYFFLSFEDVKGKLVDSLLSLDYKYNRYFGAGLGLNSTHTSIKTDIQEVHYELRNEVTGFMGYLIFSY